MTVMSHEANGTYTELPSFPDVIKEQLRAPTPPITSPTHDTNKPHDSNDPTTHNTKAASHSSSYAFLSDAEIGASWIFRIVCMFQYFMCRYFHSYSIQGLDSADRSKGALFFTMHTTHSADIFASLCTTFIVTGRVCRSLIHRWIMLGYPWLKYWGSVAGERHAAHQLLTKGYWTAVIPGGAPEALVGNDRAYELRWGARNGFAAVAMRAGVPLYPTFTVNMEEMRFNPVLFAWNKLKLYKPYDWIIQKNIPIITRCVYYIAMSAWWWISFICIPIPVPVKLVIGPSIPYDKNEDPRAVAERAHKALQSLIDEHQGRRYMDHIAALQMRFTNQQIYILIAGYVSVMAIVVAVVVRVIGSYYMM